MTDLHNIGLRGRLPIFIQNFLSGRSFSVRIGSVLSERYSQEMGVPQGCILSVTLFSIKINNITKCLKQDMNGSLYVDDFLVCYRSSSMNTIERQLQLQINSLVNWTDKNGFKFSGSKTVCVHFCHKRKLHHDPVLHLSNTTIPTVEETKFLGVIFDKKLSFIPHIMALRKKCQNSLNLLRVVGHKDWGADRMVMLRLYHALIRSKLDYGSAVYGSARKSYLEMLDPIQNSSLRLCLGAFRTSPADSLCVEAGELPLSLRRLKISLQYAVKVSSNPSNPAYKCTFDPRFENRFRHKVNSIKSFGVRMEYILDEIGFQQYSVANFHYPNFPIWSCSGPEIMFSLANYKKGTTPPHVFSNLFLEIKDAFSSYTHVYTDGSKNDTSTSSAVVIDGTILKERISHKASIFTAELHAIVMALRFMKSSNEDEFILFSDSMSSLEAIHHRQWTNPLILCILTLYHELCDQGKQIFFCWIPSHIGIKGNEEADKAAKSAADLPISNILIPYTDYKSSIVSFVNSKWQTYWNDQTSNKLHEIQSEVTQTDHLTFLSRREQCVLSRLRIGHSHYTHAYILKKEDQPFCIGCQCPITVKHILIECHDFFQIRSKYFRAKSLQDLFKNVDPRTVFDFLREINLYHRI